MVQNFRVKNFKLEIKLKRHKIIEKIDWTTAESRGASLMINPTDPNHHFPFKNDLWTLILIKLLKLLLRNKNC